MNKRLSVATLLLSCLVLAGCPGEPEPPPSRGGGPRQGQGRPNTGQTPPSRQTAGAPMFRLPALDGREVAVRGPAALFFFTTWCGYCKQALPEVNRIADTARSRGWQVYGIDVGESPDLVMHFAQTYRPGFPVLLDRHSQVAGRFNIAGFPTFVVIDAGGRVTYQGHDIPRGF